VNNQQSVVLNNTKITVKPQAITNIHLLNHINTFKFYKKSQNGKHWY